MCPGSGGTQGQATKQHHGNQATKYHHGTQGQANRYQHGAHDEARKYHWGTQGQATGYQGESHGQAPEYHLPGGMVGGAIARDEKEGELPYEDYRIMGEVGQSLQTDLSLGNVGNILKNSTGSIFSNFMVLIISCLRVSGIFTNRYQPSIRALGC